MLRFKKSTHHLTDASLMNSDDFSWTQKIEMPSVKARESFEAYPGGTNRFLADATAWYHDPRRFTTAPPMICTGKHPS